MTDPASSDAAYRGPSPGFADAVASSQAVFRAVLTAMAHPGQPIAPPPDVGTMRPLAAVALTLCDLDTPVWLAPGLPADLAADLRFHCGCPLVVEPGAATFAFVGSFATLPPLHAFHPGEPDYPDTGATVVIQGGGLDTGPRVRLRGPGIPDAEPRLLTAGTDAFWRDFQQNRAGFPLGVDVLLLDRGGWIGLPRSVEVEFA